MAAGGKWLNYGCFGLLGTGVLVLLLVALVSGVAWITSEPEQMQSRVLTPEIPSSSTAGEPIAGRVILDIRDAELHLAPAEPGEPLRVLARYDVNAFALADQFDPATEDDGEWTYRVTFGKGDRPGVFSGLVSVVRRTTARVDVFLPAEIPIDLALDMKEGGAVVRLGGLWLRNAEVAFRAAAVDLDIKEPLREPMDTLSIRTAMGGSLLNNLGNASPRRLDVSYSTGGIDMGLHGQWLRDAEINIECGIGGGAVHLPRNVIIKGLDREPSDAPGESGVKRTTLTFSVTEGLGRLEFS